MINLKKDLEAFLSGARAVGILGVGSELRADDAAGMLVAEILDIYSNRNTAKAKFRVFYGGTAPENLTGEIKKFTPSHLIVVDTAELGGKPGHVQMFDKETVGNFSFSTHKLPLKIMIDYLLQSIELMKVSIIGLQPKSLDFGKAPSEEVKKSVSDLASLIEDVMEGR